MYTIISHQSAFSFWRNFHGDIASLPRVRRPCAPSSPELPREAVEELLRIGFSLREDAPLDLLFSSRKARSHRQGVRAHLRTAPLPRDSIIRIAEHLCVVSPELCFMQIARKTTLPRAALMGCELCSTYAQIGADRTLAARPPLTSTARLRALALREAEERRTFALEALSHVMDAAASPMEAKVALLLSLPTRLGGYGLPKPLLNEPLVLGPDALRLYPRSPCRLDLFWPKASFAVEYDGAAFHMADAHAKDVARLAALRLEGIDVLELTKAQVADRVSFDRLARTIAGKLGIRLRIRRSDFARLHAELRRQLLGA